MTLNGLQNRICWFLINNVYSGTGNFEKKRKLLNKLGHQIGEGSKVVGPVFATGRLVTGKECWIGKNLRLNGNGTVVIGDNCDIAPEVTFQTGSHNIGSHKRRAGEGYNDDIVIGNGCWIGVRSTILGGIKLGDGCVVAACACVTKEFGDDVLVGGVPAKEIKELPYD